MPAHQHRWAAAALLAVAGHAMAAGLTEGDARRFLSQASFGRTDASVAEVMRSGNAAWLQRQFTLSGSDYPGGAFVDHGSSVVCLTGSAETCKRDNYSLFPVQVAFFRNAINQTDHLRQRTALALSEILVVSGKQIRRPYAMANYQRIFLRHAFGNFREVLQPFSIGPWLLNADGTRQLDAGGQPRPSYDQDTVEGFAHVFTGWTYATRPGATRNRFPNPVNYAGTQGFPRRDATARRSLAGDHLHGV